MSRDFVDALLDQWRNERPELDASGLGVEVRIELIAKLLKRNSAECLARLGLKTWEYDVLAALRRQGSPYELPATKLANASLLTSGAMTTRIDHLKAKGLVKRTPDPSDRRGVRIGLTKRGLVLVDKAVESRFAAAESSVASLDKKSRVTVASGLRTLMIALGSITDDTDR